MPWDWAKLTYADWLLCKAHIDRQLAALQQGGG
jgi:hypothetical protein